MKRVVVVIPCHRVANQVLGVVARIGPEVTSVYCVDDACPEGTGSHIEAQCSDPRVRVLRHERNEGVGGATATGIRAALADGADVIVKLDGDGQMDPADLPRLVRPILDGTCDFAKGNRFFDPAGITAMPWVRLIGNASLSFFTKVSSGYWNIFDPTNGYIAIHASVASALKFDKINRGYFFESDLLFRLNILGAVVCDVPMVARYGTETSRLRARRAFVPFLVGNIRNFFKRFLYNYVLRDFNVATVETLLGLTLIVGGTTFGLWHWYASSIEGMVTPAGTVMLAALPIILGLQLLLAAVNYDLMSVPRIPLHPRLEESDHRI